MILFLPPLKLDLSVYSAHVQYLCMGFFLTHFILTLLWGKNANKVNIYVGIYLVTIYSYAGHGFYMRTSR